MSDISFGFENSSFSLSTNSYSDSSWTVKKKLSIKNKILKLSIVLTSILLIFIFILYFILLPAFSNAKFIFSADGSLTESELKIIAGIGKNARWADLDSSVISKKLASYPLIKSASVKKRFPDTVYIETIERQAVAIAFTVINGKTVPMEIDKDGVVFRIGSENCTGLTIISGLHFKNPKAGMRVHSLLRPLFIQIDTLMKKNPILLSTVSEIKVEERKYGGYDLIIYPSQIPMSVAINSALNENSLRYVFVLVDVAREGNLVKLYDCIDARGENAVYKKREVINE